jgi:hypothetical protein
MLVEMPGLDLGQEIVDGRNGEPMTTGLPDGGQPSRRIGGRPLGARFTESGANPCSRGHTLGSGESLDRTQFVVAHQDL